MPSLKGPLFAISQSTNPVLSNFSLPKLQRPPMLPIYPLPNLSGDALSHRTSPSFTSPVLSNTVRQHLPNLQGPHVPVGQHRYPVFHPPALPQVPVNVSSLLGQILSKPLPPMPNLPPFVSNGVSSHSSPFNKFSRPRLNIASKVIDVTLPSGNFKIEIPMKATKLVVKNSLKLGLSVSIDNRKLKLVLHRVDLSKEKRKLQRNAAAKRIRHRQQQLLFDQQRFEEEHRRQLEELEPVSPSDPFLVRSHFLSEMFPNEDVELPNCNLPLIFTNDLQVRLYYHLSLCYFLITKFFKFRFL